MENLLLWLVVGTFSGLFIYLLFPTKKEYLFSILIAGVTGAFFGGTLYSLLRIGTYSVAIDPIASLMAVIGAMAILRLVRRIADTKKEEKY